MNFIGNISCYARSVIFVVFAEVVFGSGIVFKILHYRGQFPLSIKRQLTGGEYSLGEFALQLAVYIPAFKAIALAHRVRQNKLCAYKPLNRRNRNTLCVCHKINSCFSGCCRGTAFYSRIEYAQYRHCIVNRHPYLIIVKPRHTAFRVYTAHIVGVNKGYAESNGNAEGINIFICVSCGYQISSAVHYLIEIGSAGIAVSDNGIRSESIAQKRTAA